MDQRWGRDGLGRHMKREKFVVVDIFSHGCGPCMAAIPNNPRCKASSKKRGLCWSECADKATAGLLCQKVAAEEGHQIQISGLQRPGDKTSRRTTWRFIA